MKKIILYFLLLNAIISVNGCIPFFTGNAYTYEQLQMVYPPDSEQMFWVERYGIPDDIEVRNENNIKIEVFYWSKGKPDEIWIQFNDNKATIFSFL